MTIETGHKTAEELLRMPDDGFRHELVLVADPGNRILTVYCSPRDVSVLREGDTVDGGDVVPSWTLSVAQLFE